MYDSVHLLKNLRNNLISTKKFIFPPFQFTDYGFNIKVSAGDISWALLHGVHEKDKTLSANFRKACKLGKKTQYPGNNKQDVNLALNIFHETTSAAIQSYFPSEYSASKFLKLFSLWWVVSNTKMKYSNNIIGNAAVMGDSKPQFIRALAHWVQEWQNLQYSSTERYCLTTQTSNALVITLQSTSSLIEDLLFEGYNYVLTSRFQSDPLERHISKYRQMSGGRFLVGLR